MLELPEDADDGLAMLPIKAHSLEKYRVVWHFARQFSTGMKLKWGRRVYVDLFSGPGLARVEGDGRIVKGSPLLALDVPDPFDHYVFCEANPDNARALEARVERLRPDGVATKLLVGDVNERASEVHAAIPRGRKGATVLAFCLADPYRLADLAFDTLRVITTDRFVDVAMLVPTAMEIQRNIDGHLQASEDLDLFLGTTTWRQAWVSAVAKAPGVTARSWALEFIGQRMRDELGYICKGPEAQVYLVTSGGTPRYDLAFFSRDPLGIKFAGDAKKGVVSQLPLF